MAVDKLVDSSQLNSDLTSVANAIRTKGGTSESLAFPSGFVSAIQNIPSGGGSVEEAKAIFIDYDGTVIAEKTKTEINAMSSNSDLPANPSHTGLTAQGWNWTVAQLKAQFTAMPNQQVIVGQMYVTTSGATEIDVIMQEGRLSPTLTICPNGTISVDWGDGTTPDEVTGTSYTTRKDVYHTYASAGAYTIKISKTSGNGYEFYGSNQYTLLRKSTSASENRVYTNTIQSIRIGNNVRIGSNAFYNCHSLSSITIPSGVTSIEFNAFYYCYSLSSITIPNTVTSIGDSAFSSCYSLSSITIPSGVTSIANQTFYYCYSLTSITIPSGVTSIGSSAFSSCYSLSSITIPSGVTSIANGAFYYCYSLSSITIPNTVTSIGNNAFYYCYSLSSITIPNTVTSIGYNVFYNCVSLSSITIPNTVTSIEKSVFSGCYSLSSITIPNTVTSIGNSAFNNCASLSSITIPSGVTSIGSSVFSGCYSLTSITIPSEVTSIGNSMFANCVSLAIITIPSGVTSIGDNAFLQCYGVSEYHILPTTPPTLGNTVFTNIPSDCVIYVPYSADHSVLEAYKTATNWSAYANKIQEEPQ